MNIYQMILDDVQSRTVTYRGQKIDFDWGDPADTSHGLLSSSVTFKLAKQLSTAPHELAQQLIAELSAAGSSPLYQFVAVGPYINVVLTEAGLREVLADTNTWSQPMEADQHVLFEYVSLNVAKKPHIGHMRNINIGESLFRILSTKYSHITTDNHWGDWGVQFGIVLWAFKRNLDKQAYTQDPLEELQRLYIWGNQQKDIIEDWDTQVREEFKKLEDGEPENRRLWGEFVELSQAATKHILEVFNVTPHDLNQGESFYEPYMKQLTEFMEAHDIWDRDSEARYLDFEKIAAVYTGSDEEKHLIAQLGRCYLISSAGYTTYAYRDVAARLQWMHELKVDTAITITDYKQNHSFAQAFAIISYLAQRPDFIEQWGAATAQRLSRENLIHVPYGRLKISGQQLSTREGGTLDLKAAYHVVTEAVKSQFDEEKNTTESSTINKVAIASLKWADLNRDRTSDVDLNPQQIISVEGDTGVYQLYTLARLYSILDKNSSEETGSFADTDELLLNEVERSLVAELVHGSAALKTATQELAPHHITNHLRLIAQRINSWYAQYSVSQESDPKRRLQLLIMIKKLVQHIEQGLHLLAIEPVKKL